MEPTTGNKPVSGRQGGAPHNKGQGAADTSAGGAQKAGDPHPETSPGSEIMDQTREALNNAYETTSQVAGEAWDKTSRAVNETWRQAADYGRENPGSMTLIAFGAGIGVGLLLANGIGSRSRTSRLVPPVATALSKIVTELFR
ncbi:MAG TPA: hypothetical protein VFD58_20880 [Blastocatellia bacterium]|nr:hypothetical protein [Blastocatellia bacterium]